jgi:hypothetical protein
VARRTAGVESVMDNRRDEQGHPVCPICGRSVEPSRVSVSVRDVTLHPDCLGQFLSAHCDGGEEREA